MEIGRSDPLPLEPHLPQLASKLMGGLNGFGAGRPLVSRGREAPGRSGPGGPWSQWLGEGRRGRVYKTANPLFLFSAEGDEVKACAAGPGGTVGTKAGHTTQWYWS